MTINLCYSRISRRKALSEPLTSLITNLVVDLATPPDQIVESREVLEVLQRGIDARLHYALKALRARLPVERRIPVTAVRQPAVRRVTTR